MKIAPSMLAADISNLASEVRRIPSADYIHVDVMDGNYVPNITFGQEMVKKLSELTNKPLDVHLMIMNPQLHIEEFVKAGASVVTIHPDSTMHLHRQLMLIRQLGAKAGVALNPADPISLIENVLEVLDQILIMTVNPGYGGQVFIEGQLGKIALASEMAKACGRRIEVEVDGGINLDTGAKARNAGASILVAGTYIFSAEDPDDAIRRLRGQ